MSHIPVWIAVITIFKHILVILQIALHDSHKSIISMLINIVRSPSPAHSLCVVRSSTYLCISVWCSGSSEEQGEPQRGERTEISSQPAPTHTTFIFSTGSMLLVNVTYDDILIGRLFFPSSPQIQRAGSKTNPPTQDQPHSSGQGERAGRRRQHRHRQKPPSEPQQNTIQQMLHPGNLLRRLLPSSSLNPRLTHPLNSHTVKLKVQRHKQEQNAVMQHLRHEERHSRNNAECWMRTGPAGRKLVWRHADKCWRNQRRSCLHAHLKGKLNYHLLFRSNVLLCYEVLTRFMGTMRYDLWTVMVQEHEGQVHLNKTLC